MGPWLGSVVIPQFSLVKKSYYVVRARRGVDGGFGRRDGVGVGVGVGGGSRLKGFMQDW